MNVRDEGIDPFDALALPLERQRPRASFARALRIRLLDELALTDPELAPIHLPERIRTMQVTPYLSVRDGDRALAWYETAFGAVEALRVIGDDGRVGHAEFSIGGARFYLADEHPEIGFSGPASLGGSAVMLHLDVPDVDALFARAVAAGATARDEPADQPHGARHGSLIDPFGHRWLLSQQIERVDPATYGDRARGSGFTVVSGAAAPPASGGIWASIVSDDPRALIGLYTNVFGFVARLVVPDAEHPDVVVHSQLSWPEGGVLQVSSASRDDNVFSQRPIGANSLYVITADPEAVWHRCVAADMRVVLDPTAPEYAPDTMVFSVADPDGNIFSFGGYAGEA